MLILSLKYLSLYIFYISALILAGCIAHDPAFYVNKSRRIPFLDPGHAHAREVEYLLVKGYKEVIAVKRNQKVKMIKREPIAKARSLIICFFFDNNIFFLKNLPTFLYSVPSQCIFFQRGRGWGVCRPPTLYLIIIFLSLFPFKSLIIGASNLLPKWEGKSQEKDGIDPTIHAPFLSCRSSSSSCTIYPEII